MLILITNAEANRKLNNPPLFFKSPNHSSQTVLQTKATNIINICFKIPQGIQQKNYKITAIFSQYCSALHQCINHQCFNISEAGNKQLIAKNAYIPNTCVYDFRWTADMKSVVQLKMQHGISIYHSSKNKVIKCMMHQHWIQSILMTILSHPTL